LIPRYAAYRGIKIFYKVAPILKLYFVGDAMAMRYSAGLNIEILYKKVPLYAA
jgi:hypothetical protein